MFSETPDEKMLKYQRWYDQIIARGRARYLSSYKERHHIVPRSCGGSDRLENLVDLTYREHFLVHWLLTKIYSGVNKRAMVHALHAMTLQVGHRIISSWQFEVAKRAIADAVAERKRERHLIRRHRKEAEDAAYFNGIAASEAVNTAILTKTPWRARATPTIIAAQETVRGMIEANASSIQMRSSRGRSALGALSKLWVECSKQPKRKRRKRPFRIDGIKISPALKLKMMELSKGTTSQNKA